MGFYCTLYADLLKVLVLHEEHLLHGDLLGGEQGEEARKMMEDQDKLVEEIFAHEDEDKDGFISHNEFSGPKHDEL